MIVAAAFFALAVLCTVAASVLATARWPRRDPAVAILLWQALGLSWGLALIGGVLTLGLAPYCLGVSGGIVAMVTDIVDGEIVVRFTVSHLVMVVLGLVLTAALAGALLVATVEVTGARRQHRRLLSMVGQASAEAPGAFVLDHPSVVAYCMPATAPGTVPVVVVSAGTLTLLDRDELSAVLAHEWAHARGRHHLVLLPFKALRRLLPHRGVAAAAFTAVELLVEMCADDRARHQHGDRRLAAALLRFCTAAGTGAPAGALAVTGGDEPAVAVRVRRLLTPPPRLPAALRLAAYCCAVGLVALPVVLAVLPF